MNVYGLFKETKEKTAFSPHCYIDHYYIMLDAGTITLIVIFALESAAIIIGNTFTIFVFWTQKLRLKRTCFLLINLAIADLLVGIVEAVVLVTSKISKAEGKEVGRNQHPSVVFHAFGSSTSVFFLALISVERVYAVLWPFRHRTTSTRVYIYSIIFAWLAGFCMAGLSLLKACDSNVDTAYANVTVHLFLLIALLIILVSFLSICLQLHSRRPELQVHNKKSTERNLRISKTFFMVVAVSLMLWLPAFVVYIVREFCWECIPPIVFPLVNVLHLANSMVNPIVYSFRMQIFKDALRKYWEKLRQNDNTTSPAQLSKGDKPKLP